MPRRASHDGTVYEQILEVEAGQDTGTGCPTLPYRSPFRSDRHTKSNTYGKYHYSSTSSTCLSGLSWFRKHRSMEDTTKSRICVTICDVHGK